MTIKLRKYTVTQETVKIRSIEFAWSGELYSFVAICTEAIKPHAKFIVSLDNLLSIEA